MAEEEEEDEDVSEIESSMKKKRNEKQLWKQQMNLLKRGAAQVFSHPNFEESKVPQQPSNAEQLTTSGNIDIDKKLEEYRWADNEDPTEILERQFCKMILLNESEFKATYLIRFHEKIE